MTTNAWPDRIAAGELQTLDVTDTGHVQGVTLGKETLNEWLGQIKSATSPSLIPDMQLSRRAMPALKRPSLTIFHCLKIERCAR